MKAILIALLVALLSLTACNKPLSTPESPVEPAIISESSPIPTRITSNPFDTPWDDRALFQEGLIEAEQKVLDRLPGATMYHIDLQIPDDFLVMQGKQEVRYTNRENEPLNEVYFRLFPNTAGGAITISELKVNGQNVEPIYEYEKSALRVPMTPALQPDEHADIEMNFAVEIPREMGGNYGLFGYFDDVLVLDESYPVIPVYDDEGWNVEVPPPNADVSYVDAGFYLVRVTAPANLTIVTSGIKVGRELKADDGTQVLTIAAGPIRDFYLAASDTFTVISKTVGETTINSYSVAGKMEHAKIAMDVAAGALKSFGTRLGTYPYTEFDIVSTPMQALGMEYPGIVAVALKQYDPEKMFGDVPSRIYLESAVAHEVGHQWFYNAVGSDQVDEPWLDEANVQYITGLYYVDTSGEEAAKGFRDSWYGRWDRVGREDIPIGLPAGDYSGQEYGAIVYGRGPIFIETLAETMGQKTFDEFYRDYYQLYQWGIAGGHEFKGMAERFCRCDLTPLFEEWVYEK